MLNLYVIDDTLFTIRFCTLQKREQANYNYNVDFDYFCLLRKQYDFKIIIVGQILFKRNKHFNHSPIENGGWFHLTRKASTTTIIENWRIGTIWVDPNWS